MVSPLTMLLLDGLRCAMTVAADGVADDVIIADVRGALTGTDNLPAAGGGAGAGGGVVGRLVD